MAKKLKNMHMRLLAMTCIAAIIVGLYQPVAVKAYIYEESVNTQLTVAGQKMISSGMLMKSTLKIGDGLVTYDKEKNILTLDNVYIDGGIIIQELDGITIVIKGTVTVVTTDDSITDDSILAIADHVTLIGEGNAKLILRTGSNDYDGGLGIGCSKYLDIKNLGIDMFSYSASCMYSDYINIENSNIIARSALNNYSSLPENVFYFDIYPFGSAIGAIKITMKNSSMDVEGIRSAFIIAEPIKGDADTKITDTSGNELNLVRMNLNKGKAHRKVYSKEPERDEEYDGYECAETHVIVKNYHKLEKHEAVAPKCNQNGNIEYYSCESCGTYYSDAEAKNTITYEQTIQPATPDNHMAGEPVQENRVEATQTKEGSYDEVVYCQDCKTELSREQKIIPKLERNSESNVNSNDESNGNSNNESNGNSNNVSLNNSNDRKDSVQENYRTLQARESGSTSNSIKIKWNKVKGADGYIVYGAECGDKYKKIRTITKGKVTSYTHKKLKKGTYYRYKVVAYKKTPKKGKVNKKVNFVISNPVYVTTTGGKYTNPSSIKITGITKQKLTIKKEKKVMLKAKIITKHKPIKQYRKLKYESSNSKIATVSSNGSIKGLKKGTCYVYVYAQNGIYNKVKVRVK